MRKTTQFLIAGVLALLAGLPAMASENPQKPGKWQIKVQMEMPNMPIQIPPVTLNMCLTEEDLKDPQKSIPSDSKRSDCKVADYAIDGNTVTWSVDCPKQKSKGTGKMTFSEDSYEGWMKMTIGEQEMTTKYSGKWMGTCEK